MKQGICTAIGAVGSLITTLFGGWSTGIITLLIFMAVDYFSGLIVAGVFKASKKTTTGALESNTCFKGLCKKGMILLVVLVAYRLDVTICTNYICDGAVIAFICNETLSIIENAGLMGIPIPNIIKKAIDILQQKKDGGNNGNI